MIESFCTTCQRITYVQEGADPFCPVCSSPLLDVDQTPDSEAG